MILGWMDDGWGDTVGQRNGAGGKFMRDDRWDGNDLQCWRYITLYSEWGGFPQSTSRVTCL